MGSLIPPRLDCRHPGVFQRRLDDVSHITNRWRGPAIPHFNWQSTISLHITGGTTKWVAIIWPARVKAKGEIRSQFTYVTDIALIGRRWFAIPEERQRTTQKPFDGTSMVYTFDNPQANETHTTQYFETFGNCGIFIMTGGGVHAPISIPGRWCRCRRSRRIPGTLSCGRGFQPSP